MGNLDEGIRNIIKSLGIKPGERVVIITDRETLPISGEIKKAVYAVTDKVRFFTIEDFGPRPLKDVPDEIKSALEDSDAGMYLAQSAGPKASEIKNVIGPIRSLVIKHGVRYAHMPNINEEIMETGMCTDFVKVHEFTEKVLEAVRSAGKITVKTPAGTDMEASFSSKYSWVNLCGYDIKPGVWTNLPGDEIFTYPESVNGTAVVDGVMGGFFSKKYGLLDANPVRLEIVDGRIKSVSCGNAQLESDLNAYIRTDENSNRIGEFAFGTNIFLKKLIGRNLQDEKMPGVHIAAGNAYREFTNAPYTSKAHVDFVMKSCSAWIDDKKIMEEGKYLICSSDA